MSARAYLASTAPNVSGIVGPADRTPASTMVHAMPVHRACSAARVAMAGKAVTARHKWITVGM